MAALLQSYPQQSTSISMLQSRPTSSSGILPTSQNQVNHQPANKTHSQITSLHGMNNVLPLANYRGPSLITSIAPYAFTSTPDLNLSSQSIQSNSVTLNDKNTTVISSKNVTVRKMEPENQKGSTSRNSSPIISNVRNSTGPSAQIFDELAVKKTDSIASAAHQISSPGSCLAQNLSLQTSKASPGRYRRSSTQTIDSTNSPGAQTQNNSNNSDIMPCSFSDFSLQMPSISDLVTESNNDAKQGRSGTLEPQRYRHRSLHSFNGTAVAIVTNPTPIQSMNLPSRPYSSHRRGDSTESSASIRSSSSKVNKSNRKESLSSLKSYSSQSQVANSTHESNQMNKENSESIKIPPRSSSSDAVKRHVSPSPLSNPVIMEAEPVTKDSFASAVSTALQRPTVPSNSSMSKGNIDSQAAAQLNAISKKDGKKSKKFRLRRAISFGSAAELQKITNSKKYINNSEDNLDVKNGKPDDELDAEQTRIAEQQEAGGIGSGIYTGQGNFFSGSTDNLSISSTASSASVMIRKMGKGMKKSTRSLVGIFRSKNSNGVSSENLGINASEPQLSVIEVEAERDSMFQKKGPHNTSLKLEKTVLGKPILEIETSFANSDRLGSSSTENSAARKSIVGGDKERAEALAAVKKGILKRTGVGPDSSTSAVSSQSFSNNALQLPLQVNGVDSPILPLPRTPNDDQHGLRRAGSGTFGSEDYFSSMLRFGGSPKSHTETLLSSIGKRNTTFSPRIQFHDTWPSREYDRRGEVATCNRLTPILAQQIKEELNTFKMEMEVHETSKIYTHFF